MQQSEIRQASSSMIVVLLYVLEKELTHEERRVLRGLLDRLK